MIHSFDVFDTCLLRTCGHPSSVFRMTFHAWKKAFPEAAQTWSEEEFVVERIRAEQTARLKGNTEETTIDVIWRQLSLELGVDFTDNLPSIELSCENQVLRPNPEILSRIQAIRKNGARILFLSDMYLPYDFVLAELLRHGLFQHGDSLYLSSEVGLTKHTGNLYHHVLKEEAISANQLHHTGDNHVSDFVVPSKIGIHAQHYTGSVLTNVEKRVLLCATDDPGYVMPIVSAMREYRLATQTSGTTELVGKFLGPVLVLIAQWVLQTAAKSGIKHLYFFSRDCQALAKVAAIISKERFGIQCRYLLVSRQALFLPSAPDCNAESMPWMFRSFEKPTLGSLLAKLELNADEWIGRFQSLHDGSGEKFIVSSPADKQKFWDILQGPAVRPLLMKKIQDRRESALHYFREQGILDHDRFGVVDMGWYGTCQSALKNIIESVAKTCNVHGFFLGLARDRLPKSQTGPMTALFEQKPTDDPQDSRNDSVFDHITKIEHILGLADHPSVHRYENGIPAFLDGKVADEQTSKNIKQLHDEVERFVHIYKQMRSDKTSNDNVIRQCADTLLRELWYNPSIACVKILCNVESSVDANNLDSAPLVRPYDHRFALKQLLPRRFFGNPPVDNEITSWPAASCKISPKSVKLLFKIKALMQSTKQTLKWMKPTFPGH